MSVTRAVFLVIVVATAEAGTWVNTIRAASRMRTLTQKMAQEWLLVAANIDVENNTRKCINTVHEFANELDRLVEGDAARGVFAAPTLGTAVVESVAAMQTQWAIMRPVFEEDVVKVQVSDVPTKEKLYEDVALESRWGHRDSEALVQALFKAADQAGESLNPVLDIVDRQTMLIHRLMKQVLFIAIGWQIEREVEKLMGNRDLFDSSHTGVVGGAAWADIPALTDACSKAEMNRVGYIWTDFKAMFDVVALESDLSVGGEMQIAANVWIEDLNELSDKLAITMIKAADLITQSNPTCELLDGMTEDRWTNVLVAMQNLRDTASQVFAFYSYIASDYNPDFYRVEMTGAMYSSKILLRELNQGSEKKDLPGALSQSLVNKIVMMDVQWYNIQEALTGVISGEPASALLTQLVMLQSEAFQTNLNLVVEEYVTMIQANAPSVNAALVAGLSLQTSRFERMAQAATLVLHGTETDLNKGILQETRQAWLDTTDAYLRGSAAYNTTKTNNICFVKQMRLVSSTFLHFDEALSVVTHANASGEEYEASAADMLMLTELGHQSMALAIDAYIGRLDFDPPARRLAGKSSDSATGTATDSHGNLHYVGDGCGMRIESFLTEDWLKAIAEIARLAASGREVGFAWLVDRENSSRTMLAADAIASLQDTLGGLTYGRTEREIMAPFGQSILDFWNDRADHEWHRLQSSLEGNEVEVAVLLNDTENFATSVDAALDPYMAAMETYHDSVMGARTLVAVRQRVLASKILEDAAAAGAGAAVDAKTVYEDSVALFAQIHGNIRNGGGSTPKALMKERPDLIAQWEVVDAAWEAFKGETQEMASALRVDGAASAQTKLSMLDEELGKFVDLYIIVDPPAIVVPPPFDWTAVGFTIMFGYLFVVVVSSVYLTLKQLKKAEAGKAEHRSANAVDPLIVAS